MRSTYELERRIFFFDACHGLIMLHETKTMHVQDVQIIACQRGDNRGVVSKIILYPEQFLAAVNMHAIKNFLVFFLSRTKDVNLMSFCEFACEIVAVCLCSAHFWVKIGYKKADFHAQM